MLSTRETRLTPILLAVLVLPGVLPGCGGEANSRPGTQPDEQAAPSVDCSPTAPNGNSPPGEPGTGHHGNGELWTALWPDGVIKADERFVRPDGSVGMKFPWWADVPVDENGLVIRGERIDGAAPPLRVEGPSPGWPETGFSGTAFWASGLIFPTEGCWRVTATAGDATLTFVTLVEKV